MKFLCYLEGFGDDEGIEIDRCQSPLLAAQEYCRLCSYEFVGEIDVANIIVEPKDEEAKALGGWHSDEESEFFRMFVVTPTITWKATEVQKF